ncbi:MAG: hypothetical protein Q7R45_05000, partial [Sulfuricaulis sp.]|nr:hypothetical protein [Sulfuricaulis sp.]
PKVFLFSTWQMRPFWRFRYALKQRDFQLSLCRLLYHPYSRPIAWVWVSHPAEFVPSKCLQLTWQAGMGRAVFSGV